MKSRNREGALVEICKFKLSKLSLDDRLSCMLDFWSIDNEDVEFAQLSLVLQNEISSSNEPLSDYNDKKYDELIMLSLINEYKGVTNEFIAMEMAELGLGSYTIHGDVDFLIPCPCCGYRTLDSRGDYDVCGLCKWEDSGLDEEDKYSGPNHMTLRDAKEQFLRKKATLQLEKWVKA